MDPIKRVRLAVLFLIAAALFAGRPALAGSSNQPVELTNTGVEPNASGQARIVSVKRMCWPYWGAQVDVKCQGLTPNAWYYVCGVWDTFGRCQANSEGVLYYRAETMIDEKSHPIGVSVSTGPEDVLVGILFQQKPRSFELSPWGDERGASGQATLVWDSGLPLAGDLSVSCKGLTPGATYRIKYFGDHYEWNDGQWVKISHVQTVFETTANKKDGALRGQGSVVYDLVEPWYEWVEVCRVEPNGEVCVLRGGR